MDGDVGVEEPTIGEECGYNGAGGKWVMVQRVTLELDELRGVVSSSLEFEFETEPEPRPDPASGKRQAARTASSKQTKQQADEAASRRSSKR